MSDLLQLTSAVELQAAADQSKPARFTARAYSGDVMRPQGWEALVIDLAGVVLPAQVPLLADHENRVSNTLGHGRPVVDNGELTVSGVISRGSEAAERYIKLSQDGMELGVSVGVEPGKRERIPPGESAQANGRTFTAGPNGLLIIRSGRLREISIVPVAADTTSAVAIAAKGNLMSTEHVPDNDLLTAERNRTEAINARLDNLQSGMVGEMLPDRLKQLRAAAVAKGWQLDKLDAEASRLELDAFRLRDIRASRPTAPGVVSGRRADPSAVLQAAFLTHIGRESLGEKSLGEQAMQQAADLRCTSFKDIVRAAMSLEGRDCPSGEQQMIRAAFSTHSLTTALSDSAAKVAMDAYQQARPTWRSFCARKSPKDFKQATGVRLHLGDSLESLGPAGEVKHTTMREGTYPYRVDTFARQVRLTRQDIVNDDLGLLADVSAAFGRTAARSVSDLVFRVLLGNAGNFFHNDNGNLLTGGDSELDIDSLSAAMVLLRRQQDKDGSPLDIAPRVLLVPPELEKTGRELLVSDFQQRAATDSGPTGNIYRGALELEVEPRLSSDAFDGSSETAWFVLAGPQDAPVIVAFLNGQEAPSIEFFGLDSDPNTLGVSWRVFLDVGTALADPKAAVRSDGQ